MEKKELLGVRKSPPLTKRRRKVTAGGAGGGSMAKAIAAYLAPRRLREQVLPIKW
ncbi:Os08g0444440 [Oryza sativa Japonica Group]|uniref:Os08g0444440 protein n=1 Tax=Oryza sativa subsp. japonica TaxID=39947 RepID=C7J680_ORYSJ|nr:Os08g0444440 [Oryza sativa Japonica Group]|eukprot:NP_001175601.1 Os08g0444440 [Oryza sativa Japonica Group]